MNSKTMKTKGKTDKSLNPNAPRFKHIISESSAGVRFCHELECGIGRHHAHEFETIPRNGFEPEPENGFKRMRSCFAGLHFPAPPMLPVRKALFRAARMEEENSSVTSVTCPAKGYIDMNGNENGVEVEFERSLEDLNLGV